MLSEDVLYLSVRDLGERIQSRQLSPVELAESYLERSERLGPKLNAYAAITRDLALEQARAAEKEISAGHYRGPLHGIPYAAKDLVAVKGYPTSWGAPPFAKQTFDDNATIIERLNEAGAVLIGKAAMIELAGGLGYSSGYASLTGAAKNPWNTDCWTCGSSSGSGAIVSAALASFALGSDTRGSLICPCAHCGISGLRPSFGRVSRHGSMAIAYTTDKLGPMARTADDCGLILSVIAGHDPLDYDSLPLSEAAFQYPDTTAAAEKPLRLVRIKNLYKQMVPGLAEAFEQALSVLETNGATISEAELPEGPFEEIVLLTITIEGASAFQSLVESGRSRDLVDPTGRIGGYVGLEIPASDYLYLQRVRTFLQERMDTFFDPYDAIVAPSFPSTATPLKPTPGGDEAAYTDPLGGISSLCGLPALSVPCGFSAKKLPFGIQFVGRALNEHAVIAAARLYQEHTDWHRKRPPLS